MPQLPILSGRILIKIFIRIGYIIVNTKGSHVRLHHVARRPITIPSYKTISRGLLRQILRQADILPAEFLKMFK
ncbi:MAG: hypothetical protein A2758_00325 [Candidatus Zambryskibacteria bacterium RIFCSPHIGHO2_01_FULL_49_18]|uniref:Addiction module toxin, HicA family n=2 Tax=Candidatus Zambryskiibacteriota TaxID=1817925 RepID=A0A1G2T4N1_9BACT|nr:MAG: hypothetical protein A2758_00325 [Candidatus Zambryskibacteria bacterium RIFCSPHIGHO2_01_FULL_49_18]OHB05673.1 MAG: hypothetical protein A3A26_02210 [Candidatus Zambryskibacteria bacterium RIFCSPLOWO2_01_FULL_47_14]